MTTTTTVLLFARMFMTDFYFVTTNTTILACLRFERVTSMHNYFVFNFLYIFI